MKNKFTIKKNKYNSIVNSYLLKHEDELRLELFETLKDENYVPNTTKYQSSGTTYNSKSIKQMMFSILESPYKLSDRQRVAVSKYLHDYCIYKKMNLR